MNTKADDPPGELIHDNEDPVHGELLIRHAQVKKLSWRGFCYARVPLSDLLMLFSLSGIHYMRSTGYLPNIIGQSPEMGPRGSLSSAT